jgi:hypothetical protein
MKAILLILFPVLFFLYGCDLFSTRPAEDPDQPRSNFQTAVTPEILISNLINAFGDKNVENYLACFADSSFTSRKFQFSPSSGSLSQFPFLGDDWNRKSEEQYFNNMKSRVAENSAIVLALFNSSTNPQGDSLIYTSGYSITVPLMGTDIPENFQGELRFSMIRDDRAVWVIYFWQDTKNSDLPSWSELKGRFY